jgi:hypothetical protein
MAAASTKQQPKEGGSPKEEGAAKASSSSGSGSSSNSHGQGISHNIGSNNSGGASDKRADASTKGQARAVAMAGKDDGDIGLFKEALAMFTLGLIMAWYYLVGIISLACIVGACFPETRVTAATAFVLLWSTNLLKLDYQGGSWCVWRCVCVCVGGVCWGVGYVCVCVCGYVCARQCVYVCVCIYICVMDGGWCVGGRPHVNVVHRPLHFPFPKHPTPDPPPPPTYTHKTSVGRLL